MLLPVMVFILMALTGVIYVRAEENGLYDQTLRLVLKGTTTLFAAILAFCGALARPDQAGLLIAVGLFVCALADVTLEKHFLAGMGVFAIGHLLYIKGFFDISGMPPLSLFVFLMMAVLTILSIVLLWRKMPAEAFAYAGYALIISLMLALSLVQTPLFLLGAALFTISDMLILYRLLFQTRRLNERMTLTLYYGGQFLLGLAVYLMK